MNRLTSLIMVGAIAAASGSCLAGQVRIDDPGSPYRNPSFGGGAFQLTVVSGYNGLTGGYGGSANSFLSFCLERNEYITLGATNYTTISTAASNGGISGGSPDPLSPVTAKLYSEYRAAGSFGNLAGLGNNLLDTANEARSMQRAIWHSEGELDGSEYTGDSLAVALYTWAVNNNDGTLGNVRVLNMWGNAAHTDYKQDQLTIVPLPPAAWAGLSSLGGLVGLGVIRRRQHRA
jgi:hypothetical protein